MGIYILPLDWSVSFIKRRLELWDNLAFRGVSILVMGMDGRRHRHNGIGNKLNGMGMEVNVMDSD